MIYYYLMKFVELDLDKGNEKKIMYVYFAENQRIYI